MSSVNLGSFLLIALVSMVISMVIIPVMIKYAGVLGMVDKPDPRKVHALPIPRVGGVGIVIGALVPMFILLPETRMYQSFIIGSVILFVFGIWDDMKELGHYVKFIGQFSAAISIVYYGDLYVVHFPYIGLDSIPAYIGKPFTIIAIVGVINALNHSDGLDGLAGGESLLSFGAVAYLAYLFGGDDALIIAGACMGGIFGFLRYNTHPAQVFMGDGGSQFLGFAIAVLVLLLTQEINTVVSPALPLLLIGLPVVDILVVFYLRWKGGMNLFKATRNHIHHRLLELGFHHHESVMLIYSVQAFFVVCAIMLIYESDYLITALYLLTTALVFVALTVSERASVRLKRDRVNRGDEKFLFRLVPQELVLKTTNQMLEASVMLFLVGAAMMSTYVPVDIALSAAVLLVILILVLLRASAANFLLLRLVIFVSVGIAVYLSTSFPVQWLTDENLLVFIYFGVLATSIAIVVKMTAGEKFNMSPLDYLVLIIVMIIMFIPEQDASTGQLTWMAIQMILLFYASELVIQRMRFVRNYLSGSLLVMLAVVALRGLM